MALPSSQSRGTVGRASIWFGKSSSGLLDLHIFLPVRNITSRSNPEVSQGHTVSIPGVGAAKAAVGYGGSLLGVLCSATSPL